MSQEMNARYFSVLLEKVVNDPFPSSTIMSHIERLLDSRMRDVYVSVLLDRIERDQIPSPDMLNRVSMLLQR